MITRDNWPERWEELPAGTEISEEVYNDMLNVLPPIPLRRSPYSGFQMGEAQSHHPDAQGRFRARYLTLITAHGRYYFAGIHFGGECNFELSLN